MRRRDRQMRPEFAWEVFDKAAYAVLALVPAYAVPISPARIDQTIYFHAAKQGHKNRLWQADATASLVVVGDVVPSSHSFSTEYESGIFQGRIELVDDAEEKVAALRAITQRYTPNLMHMFDSEVARSLARTEVLRFIPETTTAKRKKFAPDLSEIRGDYRED